MLTDDFFADLQWWISFMMIFNDIYRIRDPCPITLFQTDASLEGDRGYYNGDYFVHKLDTDLSASAAKHINVKEFIFIFISAFRWCNIFVNRGVIINSYNSSVVSWKNRTTSRNPIVQFMCHILF